MSSGKQKEHQLSEAYIRLFLHNRKVTRDRSAELLDKTVAARHVLFDEEAFHLFNNVQQMSS